MGTVDAIGPAALEFDMTVSGEQEEGFELHLSKAEAACLGRALDLLSKGHSGRFGRRALARIRRRLVASAPASDQVRICALHRWDSAMRCPSPSAAST